MNPRQFLTTLAALVLAGCDLSSTAQDGTSSETQTVLQALADNLQSPPSLPFPGIRGSLAARTSTRSEVCSQAAEAWIHGGWYQFEAYDETTMRNRGDSRYANTLWMASLSEFATDSAGNRLHLSGCPSGYMQAKSQLHLRTRSGRFDSFNGLFWRSTGTGGMTDFHWTGSINYPTGLHLEYTGLGSGTDVLAEPLRRNEDTYFFPKGRVTFSFRGGTERIVSKIAFETDSIECAQIFRQEKSEEAIGYVCRNLRSFDGPWVVRDSHGGLVANFETPITSADDSMGIRILSLDRREDSLVLEYQVKTVPYTLNRLIKTAIVIRTASDPDAQFGVDTTLTSDSIPFGSPSRYQSRIAIPSSALIGRDSLRVRLERAYEFNQGPFVLGVVTTRTSILPENRP